MRQFLFISRFYLFPWCLVVVIYRMFLVFTIHCICSTVSGIIVVVLRTYLYIVLSLMLSILYLYVLLLTLDVLSYLKQVITVQCTYALDPEKRKRSSIAIFFVLPSWRFEPISLVDSNTHEIITVWKYGYLLPCHVTWNLIYIFSHRYIRGSLSKYMHFFLFIIWWHQIFSFPFCFSLLVFPILQVWTQTCAVQKASMDVNIAYY